MTRLLLAAFLFSGIGAFGNETPDPDKTWMCRAQWSMNGSTITVTEYGPTRIDAVKNTLYRCYKIGVWCHRFHEYRDCRDDWQTE